MKYILLISASALVLSAAVQVSPLYSHTTHTPDTEPVSSYKIAASYFLPEYSTPQFVFKNESAPCTSYRSNCQPSGTSCPSGSHLYIVDDGCGGQCNVCLTCTQVSCSTSEKCVNGECVAKNCTEDASLCKGSTPICDTSTKTCRKKECKDVSCGNSQICDTNTISCRDKTCPTEMTCVSGVTACKNGVCVNDKCPTNKVHNCDTTNNIASACETIASGKNCCTCTAKNCVNTENFCGNRKCNELTATCVDKTCTDYNSNYKTAIPTGQKCDTVTAATVGGLTCFTNCSTKTCSDYGSYLAKIPVANYVCPQVDKSLVGGLTCYTNSGCRLKTCFENSNLCTSNEKCIGTGADAECKNDSCTRFTGDTSSKTPCTDEQVLTYGFKTAAGSICYECRSKTCSDSGGPTCNPGKVCVGNGANAECLTDICPPDKSKTCPAGQIPSEPTWTNPAGNICYTCSSPSTCSPKCNGTDVYEKTSCPGGASTATQVPDTCGTTKCWQCGSHYGLSTESCLQKCIQITNSDSDKKNHDKAACSSICNVAGSYISSCNGWACAAGTAKCPASYSYGSTTKTGTAGTLQLSCYRCSRSGNYVMCCSSSTQCKSSEK